MHLEHYKMEVFDIEGEHFVQFSGHLIQYLNKLTVELTVGS